MGRSGYSDDYDETFPNAEALCRENIARALRGKRGQAFLRELIEALDTMPQKCLVEGMLQARDGMMCAMGVVGQKRGIDMAIVDPNDAKQVGKILGIAPLMAREIAFINDNDFNWRGSETDEERWESVLIWARSQVASSND